MACSSFFKSSKLLWSFWSTLLALTYFVAANATRALVRPVSMIDSVCVGLFLFWFSPMLMCSIDFFTRFVRFISFQNIPQILAMEQQRDLNIRASIHVLFRHAKENTKRSTNNLRKPLSFPFPEVHTAEQNFSSSQLNRAATRLRMRNDDFFKAGYQLQIKHGRSRLPSARFQSRGWRRPQAVLLLATNRNGRRKRKLKTASGSHPSEPAIGLRRKRASGSEVLQSMRNSENRGSSDQFDPLNLLFGILRNVVVRVLVKPTPPSTSPSITATTPPPKMAETTDTLDVTSSGEDEDLAGIQRERSPASTTATTVKQETSSAQRIRGPSFVSSASAEKEDSGAESNNFPSLSSPFYRRNRKAHPTVAGSSEPLLSESSASTDWSLISLVLGASVAGASSVILVVVYCVVTRRKKIPVAALPARHSRCPPNNGQLQTQLHNMTRTSPTISSNTELECAVWRRQDTQQRLFSNSGHFAIVTCTLLVLKYHIHSSAFLPCYLFFFFFFFFFEILSDLNQALPNHLAEESQTR